MLERTGAALEVIELELAPPGPGEVLVRLHASGVCHSDLNAMDGTAATVCPAVLGHEGAGVVEAVGAGVTLAPGQRVVLSWVPACGRCEECLRELPHLCTTAWAAMATGGLLDGTTRLSRDDQPVYHYCFLSSFAERAVVPAGCCVPIADDDPFDVAALVGCAITTGTGAVWRTAGVRPGERVAVLGCGGVGMSAVLAAVAVGASPVVAVDIAGDKLDAALALGATHTVRWTGGAEETAEAVREVTGGGVDYAIEATPPPEAMQAAFLSTRVRGAAVLIGIPRADATYPRPRGRRHRRVRGAEGDDGGPRRSRRLLLRAALRPLPSVLRRTLSPVRDGGHALLRGDAARRHEPPAPGRRPRGQALQLRLLLRRTLRGAGRVGGEAARRPAAVGGGPAGLRRRHGRRRGAQHRTGGDRRERLRHRLRRHRAARRRRGAPGGRRADHRRRPRRHEARARPPPGSEPCGQCLARGRRRSGPRPLGGRGPRLRGGRAARHDPSGWDVLRPGATAIVVGLTPRGLDVAQPALELLSEKSLKGCYYGSANVPVELARLADLVVAGRLHVSDVVSHLTDLDGIEEAFGRLRRGEGVRTIAVMDPESAEAPASLHESVAQQEGELGVA